MSLTPELALRIGLAARTLPDTEPGRLMAALIEHVGLPLTPEKLAVLKVKDLKEAADGELGELPLDDLKKAAALLRGEGLPEIVVEEGLPSPQPYADGDMPGSIRVAIASNGGERVDGHFGSCARFLVYQVAPGQARLIDIRATSAMPDDEDKNAWRAGLIADCQLLYIASIGGPAAAKVIRAGIHPIKRPQMGQGGQVMAELAEILAGSPPPWLAKVMGQSPQERIRFALEEEEA
ncbi:MAG: dinitrogenase iron-molybdenum cofactor biosynthesis protein [Alphaproteobacteria bacterium CG_4_10_14_0_2_um_filter_63_37]|nr:MAG: dinitrogenase iron-molybdenum cofactor biosynthesis protein [Proteobacteria bacterium CG1_02_64_396]PJA25179.1 MAG: dinitrogenase iron-molybdenum cofactor biosynthesis protein [Alphaproteobacteria bacterium CG_4_10_14_0_2_um_filter_63_37]